MSERQETIADIIAKMRNDANAAKLFKTADSRFDICRNIEQVLKIGRDYQNKDGYRGAHYDTVKLLCDAIEYQQEQLETKTKVGDCAKLREALKATLDLLWDIHNANRSPQSNQAYAVIRQIKAALAAPPRNCDKYANYIDAMEAFDVFAREQGKLGFINPYTEAFKWLFAPATEKEGGAK